MKYNICNGALHEAGKILIVEDERIIALDLQGRLLRFGYTKPVIATNGIDALKEIEIKKPDIILMDIMLSSGFDGIETANIIHENTISPSYFLLPIQMRILWNVQKSGTGSLYS